MSTNQTQQASTPDADNSGDLRTNCGQGINQGEQVTVEALADAWNLFMRLDGNDDDMTTEFRRSINRAQDIIAFRVARRVDPEVWRQPEQPAALPNGTEITPDPEPAPAPIKTIGLPVWNGIDQPGSVMPIAPPELPTPGAGCECGAHYEGQCGCPGVDWTPREVHELRAKLAEARELIDKLKAHILKQSQAIATRRANNLRLDRITREQQELIKNIKRLSGAAESDCQVVRDMATKIVDLREQRDRLWETLVKYDGIVRHDFGHHGFRPDWLQAALSTLQPARADGKEGA